MTIANFKTPRGDDIIVLTRDEYENLANAKMTDEDIQDAAAVLNFRERMAAGEEELLPLEMVERLALGEDHPIRVWRQYRGMKVKDLAATIGVTPNFLSMVERGKKDGSLKLYLKIARALKVTLDDLVRDDVA